MSIRRVVSLAIRPAPSPPEASRSTSNPLVVPPTFFYLFQPASLAHFLFTNLQFRFNLVVGSLLSPLGLCNAPTINPQIPNHIPYYHCC